MKYMEPDNSTEEWIKQNSHIVKESGFEINEYGELCKFDNQKLVPLCNFIFWPVEIIMKVTENEQLAEFKYVFEGVLKKEKKLSKVEVLVSDLSSSKWIQRHWNVVTAKR